MNDCQTLNGLIFSRTLKCYQIGGWAKRWVNETEGPSVTQVCLGFISNIAGKINLSNLFPHSLPVAFW